jgi:hypothetical protein
MASRTALRLSRLTTFVAPRPISKPAAVNGIRAFSNLEAKPKSEVVRGQEIPVSVYTPDPKGVGSEHFSIPVRANAVRKDAPAPPPENEDVVPLTKKVFDTMPPTMQKMSVHGKVIIITGYVRLA